MSQSPSSADLSATSELERYRDAWSALSHLIGQGKSFSGNERNCFFLNTQDDRFAQVARALGADLSHDSRAVATTDWNFDGAPDIWLTNRTAPRVSLLLNRLPVKDWLRIRLEGTESNRDALGARVTLRTDDPSLTMIRTVRAGDGFLSQSSKWLHFGLGDAKPSQIEIRWPSGKVETISSIQANHHYRVREGEKSADIWNPPPIRLGEPSNEAAVAEVLAGSQNPSTRTWIMGRVPLIHPHFESDELRSTDAMIGKPLLVTLWSQTCQPCVAELTEWSKLQDEFRSVDCQVIALCVDGLSAESANFAASSTSDALLDRLKWPFARGQATAEFVEGLEVLQRTFVEWQQLLPVPSSFLLDEHGMLAAIYRGAQSADVILADIRRLSASPEEQRNAAVPFKGQWASEVFPSNPTPVAKMLEMSNQESQVVDYLKRYVRLTPIVQHRAGLVNAHRQLTQRLMKLGRNADALPHFEQLIQIDSRNSVLHYNAGLAAIGARNFKRAVELLTQAAALAPEDADVHFHLGNAHLFVGSSGDAVEHFATAHRLRPKWALPANNAAWILATNAQPTLRDGKRALQLIEPFCKNWQQSEKPVPAILLGTYVAALAENGDFELAQRINEKLISESQNEEQRRGLVDRQNQLKRQQPIRER